MRDHFDVAVIGAGAAGMMAAMTAGRRGRRVVVIDHAKAPGEKIRISGGGRCNFTNLRTAPSAFLSANPHFAKSALARFTPQDFLAMVEARGISWHEKTLGQLFCDGSAREIVALLTDGMAEAGVDLRLGQTIEKVERRADGAFGVQLAAGLVTAQRLIVASGGKSIPKMGATGFAYRLAESFGLPLVETRPGLVPLTLDPQQLADYADLTGIALPVSVRAVGADAGQGGGRKADKRPAFREAMLFTHRGLSGPAILQISSYWREGETIAIDLIPEMDLAGHLKTLRRQAGRQQLRGVLADFMPKRLVQLLLPELAKVAGKVPETPLADYSDAAIGALVGALKDFTLKPAGSEGYRTAEVTLGGVDTKALHSRSMEAQAVPGLHFIGECVDVTGWLGGYNFQWAWASGFSAGQSA
ncbi:hypothetical protein BJF93_05790 [Xaviernesmea oryzae]|uniref:Uncharacterized protein n=1 Tax=Xaviernesmea oryzae TaxID=464029 RepID=A0A1Q9ARW0_9HYPH|nr:NAD(P)/FAD-dependent oxidoreductase [Xaviernesmea oryzae]OLP58140.1 hypothetical protein BJF93_05790 [Xaviernesmea oryzae]SEL81387.1 hypothetical protein SAMN04487976_11344 [Xaviernesmea oryzae]